MACAACSAWSDHTREFTEQHELTEARSATETPRHRDLCVSASLWLILSVPSASSVSITPRLSCELSRRRLLDLKDRQHRFVIGRLHAVRICRIENLHARETQVRRALRLKNVVDPVRAVRDAGADRGPQGLR